MAEVSKPPLGRLEKVDLRTYWSREDIDFTPWLAEPENIKLLSDTIGIELEVQAVEKNVGLFRADILCQDMATNQWVLIENQLERTDHGHLGQLLTYAAGLNAVTIIWIASRFTDEHRASLDWLNRVTDKDVNFFGLEIELWRIGESALAPKFNLVAQPNDWTKVIESRTTAITSKNQQIYLEFWSQLREQLITSNSPVTRTKPSIQQHMGFGIGHGNFRLYAGFTPQKQTLYITIYFKGDNAKASFSLLEAQKPAIEQEIGVPLVWENKESNKTCEIYYLKHNCDINLREQWQDYQHWIFDYLQRFYRAFTPRVKELVVDNSIASSPDVDEI